jgi:glycosyltransferase involved in cell wall biosynthesis
MTMIKPIKVLEIRSTYKGGGGPDKTILNSLLLHDKNVVEMRAVYLRGIDDQEYSIDKQAAELGLKNYFDIAEKGKFDYRVFRYLRKYILENNIDIVHSHEFKTNFYNLLLKKTLRKNNIKFIMTAHNWAGQDIQAKIYKFLDLKTIKRLDHVIAVAGFVESILRKAGISKKKITLIYNAIDTNYWQKKEHLGNLRDAFHLQDCYPVLGAVGRLMPEKDIYTMLKAFSIIVKKFPKARLFFVGEGKEGSRKEEYLAQACLLNVEKQLVFMGYTRRLLEVYNTFDIYFMTSLTEGMPNVLLEAMAMELPVVSTNVGGVSELVIDNNSGYLINPKDYKSLAEKVITLAEDLPKQQMFGKNGRFIIENKFNFRKRLILLEAFYQRLCE